MGQVIFLMLIMDRLILSLLRKNREELINILKMLIMRAHKHKVLKINHWIEMKKIREVKMKVREKMMIVKVRLFKT